MRKLPYVLTAVLLSLGTFTACGDNGGKKPESNNSQQNNQSGNKAEYETASEKVDKYCAENVPTLDAICANEDYEIDCSTAEGKAKAEAYRQDYAEECPEVVMETLLYFVEDIVEYMLVMGNSSISDYDLDICLEGESIAACEKVFSGDKCNQAWSNFVGDWFGLNKSLATEIDAANDQQNGAAVSIDLTPFMGKSDDLLKACTDITDIDWALNYCQKRVVLEIDACKEEYKEYEDLSDILGVSFETQCQAGSLIYYHKCRSEALEIVTNMDVTYWTPEACVAAYKDFTTCIVDNFETIRTNKESDVCEDKETAYDSACAEKVDDD